MFGRGLGCAGMLTNSAEFPSVDRTVFRGALVLSGSITNMLLSSTIAVAVTSAAMERSEMRSHLGLILGENSVLPPPAERGAQRLEPQSSLPCGMENLSSHLMNKCR